MITVTKMIISRMIVEVVVVVMVVITDMTVVLIVVMTVVMAILLVTAPNMKCASGCEEGKEQSILINGSLLIMRKICIS